jgi:RimJ/RimL family protein N-acetyltransferase
MLDIKLVPEAQGRGLATASLRWLVTRVFESEAVVDAVFTDPVDENVRAHALYVRCGLSPGRRPPDLGPGPSYWELRRADWERRAL